MTQGFVPSPDLSAADKATRSGSFGGVASLYERFRPGPPIEAVEWMLPDGARTVVDLGAGTGALTRLLVGRVDTVIAVEPDARMRQVLIEQAPRARAVDGSGEAMPLPDGSAHAVLASSSWHWMDVVPALNEVARVLTPGGTLGAVWAGPDPDGPFLVQAREMMRSRRDQSDDTAASDLSGIVAPDAGTGFQGLEIPDGSPFGPPELFTHRWDIALNADEIIGLMGTLSWVIVLDDDRRERLFAEARRLLSELLGVEGDVTVDVAFRADAYRTRSLTT